MGKKHAAYIQGLKELGCRPGELWQLRWDDVDFGSRTCNITPEKGSRAKQLRISAKLIGMLNTLSKKEAFVSVSQMWKLFPCEVATCWASAKASWVRTTLTSPLAELKSDVCSRYGSFSSESDSISLLTQFMYMILLWHQVPTS